MSHSDSAPRRPFQSTRWSLIVAATGDSSDQRRAMHELCTIYWPALYAFYRSLRNDHETAKDLTQGLFAHLIERDDFVRATPQRGRFRSYLRTCARNFSNSRRRQDLAERRGGKHQTISLNLDGADSDTFPLVSQGESPESAFDRRFARALIETVVDRLGREYEARGRSDRFDLLRVYLEEDGGPSYAAISEDLGTSEGAVKLMVHRLRARFRELLMMEVRHTIADPDDAMDEIDHLLDALVSTTSA